MLGHRPHRGLLVAHRGVDLAGTDIAVVLADELRQRPLVTAQQAQHVQAGEHPGIGSPEIPEVVMSRMLTAEDRPLLSHQSLDVGMPDPGGHDPSAVLHDNL